MSEFVAPSIGVDIGSQKTILVYEDGEILRTDTGTVSRPTLISFNGKKRLFGEEALSQISGDSTLSMISQLIGKRYAEINSLSGFTHRKVKISSDEKDRLIAEINFQETLETISVTALLGMYLAPMYQQITSIYGPNTTVCFPLPPNANANVKRAYYEAGQIAGIEKTKMFFADSGDSITASYLRKIHGLGGAEALNLLGKSTLIIDMGHNQTTVIVVQFPQDKEQAPTKLFVAYDENLGAYNFDLELFAHFAQICETKYKTTISENSKRGTRLMSGCERIRKLLSQLPESQITVENLIDDGDVKFSLKRDEMFTFCQPLLEKFRGLLQSALDVINASETPLAAVETFGGGVRMPVVQQIITSLAGDLPLGGKLDDSTIALGAALCYRKVIAENTLVLPAVNDSDLKETTGFDDNELEQAKLREVEFQKLDALITSYQAAYNQVEAYILDMRNAPRRKFGDQIDSKELTKVLDDFETALWDINEQHESEPKKILEHTQQLQEKYAQLTQQINVICASFLQATEAHRIKIEEELAEEAKKAAIEKENDPDADGDHDNRRLKKADRMRLVVKNKEEGTELFKGNNWRMAAARYQKALSHCAKFYDLSPEDEQEVKTLKLSLYLNLATCYIKLENWEHVLNFCNDALKLDGKNIKALYRRATYYETKKEYELAMNDAKLAQEFNPIEDKLVTKMIDRLKLILQKQKDKEKKMWSKAFA